MRDREESPSQGLEPTTQRVGNPSVGTLREQARTSLELQGYLDSGSVSAEGFWGGEKCLCVALSKFYVLGQPVASLIRRWRKQIAPTD